MKPLVFLMFVSVCAFSQTVKVTKETLRLQDESSDGFEVVLDGTPADVESSLLKYLKTTGKYKKSDPGFVFSTPVVNGKTYGFPLYAVIRDKGKGAAWIGVRPSEIDSASATIYNDLEKLIYEFGVQFQKQQVQLQIDDSGKALQTVEREQARLFSQNKDLGLKIEDNKKQKVQLETSLENNRTELEALIRKIEENKKSQDSLARAAMQIRGLIDQQKEKQKKIN